ncbi:hypothetical protein [Ammonifex thiophilus]|uniref:Uncharacterized protein n=1 Tax=Ammonifex thiophilus TaxID=444093 RepID=A0A3D8P1Q9_9THEO|nr:hypothetical protein [Ammonifex thiophilus]RDV81792.1 hypothetical protein DXX99_08810 [Ammonifex thiophilus]
MGGGKKKSRKKAQVHYAPSAKDTGKDLTAPPFETGHLSPSAFGQALKELYGSFESYYAKGEGSDFKALTGAVAAKAGELKADPATAQQVFAEYAKVGVAAVLEGKATPEEVAAGTQQVAQALGLSTEGGSGEAWSVLAGLAAVDVAAEQAAQPAWLREVSPLDPGFWDDVKEAGALGKPLMVAGPDIEDQTLTAVFCHDPADPGKGRLVLFGKLRPEAEAKLMDALAVDEKAPPGPLPSDTFWDDILLAAKSVNHHIGEGTPVPKHTLERIAKLKARLSSFNPSTPQEQEMKQTYEQYVAVLERAVEEGKKTYEIYPGGTFTRFTPSPKEEDEYEVAGGFKAKKLTGSRPAAEEREGRLYWDGEKRLRDSFLGEEYEIDLGDGYRLIYHPSRDPVPYSLRGTVELVGPPGQPDGHAALEKLSLLHLHASPVTSAEEVEVMYLERNAWAQGLTGDPEYREIGRAVGEAEKKYEAEALARLEEAAAHLSEEEMTVLAKSLVLENQRRLLRCRAGLLKRFFEKKLGLPEGGLEGLPAYQPRPLAASGKKGYHFWNRFDLTADKVKEALKGFVITHRISTGKDKVERLCRLIESGGFLACGEVRARMGVKVNTTSPLEDMKSGGASYAFTFIRPESRQGEFDIVWDPEVLLTRSDWFATKDDAFGAVNPESHYSKYEKTTDVEKLGWWVRYSHIDPQWGGQVMFKNGIDLLGIHPPRYIFVDSAADRERVLDSFAKVGVKELGGRPVEEVVRVRKKK